MDIMVISINVCNSFLVFKDLKSQNFVNIKKIINVNINENPIFKSQGPLKSPNISNLVKLYIELKL